MDEKDIKEREENQPETAVEIPPLAIPREAIEEVALSAMKDIYNEFQDELYALEEEAKKQQTHGGN